MKKIFSILFTSFILLTLTSCNNYFTNKTMLDPYDRMVGFAKIISEEIGDFDILYRLDERLAMPADEYYDYTGVPFAKFRGPQFNFDRSNLEGKSRNF